MDRFEETKQRIKDAVDIVALVEGYVALRRRGRTMVGLCPFHDEKGPSFTVYGDTQHYYCYGCGKAGDVFTFVQEREGLTFREAFEWLGERANVPTEGVLGRGGRAKGPDRVRIDQVLSAVRGWFRLQLQTPSGDRAREYLEGRGLGEAIESFGLGYHPDPRRGGGLDGAGASLTAFAKERGLPPQVLADAGLLKRSQRGEVYEPFRGRVMFPIEDEMGRVVGFGGRVLPGDDAPGRDGFVPPKYVNSPESPFFNKRRVLFGLRHVKAAGQRRIVVMEGYTDVIACHLAGHDGAVATLGTALTSEHARLLHRWADQVVLVFDGDRAGRQAAEKAYRELAATELNLRIALAPEGQDPADLVRGGGSATEGDALAELVDGAEDALTMWFRLLRGRMDFAQPVNVERAAGECAKVLARLEQPVRVEATQARMAAFLGVTSEALGVMIRAQRQRPEHRARPGGSPGSTAGNEGFADRDGWQGPGDVDPEAEALAAMGPDAWDRATPGSNGSASRANGQGGAEAPLRGADLDILAAVLADPVLQAGLDGVSFSDPSHQALAALFAQGFARGLKSREALARFAFTEAGQRPELAGILARCAERSSRINNPKEFFDSLIRGRSTFVARQTAQDLRRQAQQALAAGDREEADRLTRLYIEASRRRLHPDANPRPEAETSAAETSAAEGSASAGPETPKPGPDASSGQPLSSTETPPNPKLDTPDPPVSRPEPGPDPTSGPDPASGSDPPAGPPHPA